MFNPYNSQPMNTLILIAAKDRKTASAEFNRNFIDNVIVAGGIEVEDENVDKAVVILTNLAILFHVQEFEL